MKRPAITTLNLRRIKNHFIVTGPDIELMNTPLTVNATRPSCSGPTATTLRARNGG